MNGEESGDGPSPHLKLYSCPSGGTSRVEERYHNRSGSSYNCSLRRYLKVLVGSYMLALVCRDDGQVEELRLTLVGDGDVVQVHLEPHPQHVQPHHGDEGRRDAPFQVLILEPGANNQIRRSWQSPQTETSRTDVRTFKPCLFKYRRISIVLLETYIIQSESAFRKL